MSEPESKKTNSEDGQLTCPINIAPKIVITEIKRPGETPHYAIAGSLRSKNSNIIVTDDKPSEITNSSSNPQNGNDSEMNLTEQPTTNGQSLPPPVGSHVIKIEQEDRGENEGLGSEKSNELSDNASLTRKPPKLMPMPVGGSRSSSVEGTPNPPQMIEQQKKEEDQRDRQQAPMQLQDQLKCMNTPCTFTTYWQTSLANHIKMCKYKSGKTVITSPATSNSCLCKLCGITCDNVQEHIAHMTKVHRMKASYRCSICSITFSCKDDIEAHLQKHNNRPSDIQFSIDNNSISKTTIQHDKNKDDGEKKTPSIPPESRIEIAEEEDDEGDEQHVVFNCDCGKVYLKKSSFDQHIAICKAIMNKKRERNVQKESSLPSGSIPLTLDHFRREDIARLHNDGDYTCKGCDKDFKLLLSLSNHLSRKITCRNWYCRNLSTELAKLPPSLQPPVSKSLLTHTAPKRRIVRRPKFGSLSPKIPRTTPNKHMQIQRIRQQQMQQQQQKQQQQKEKVNAQIHNQQDEENSIQCPKCLKVFTGDKPHIAYNSHLRSTKPCVPPSKTERQMLYMQKFKNSPGFGPNSSPWCKNYPKTPASLPERRDMTEENMSIQNTQRGMEPDPSRCQGMLYYCKLCPNRVAKSRVALSCHLTVFHSLPPVNVSTPEGESYRCQTCQVLFSSKYFYNIHRYECDQKSPYLGILNGETDNTSKQNSVEQIATLKADMPPASMQSGYMKNSFKCSLCDKSGFWGQNAVKIHQKYQCSKRSSSSLPSSSRPTISAAAAKEKLASLQNGLKSRGLLPPPTRRLSMNEEKKDETDYSEIARMNEIAKTDSRLTMCEGCGKGPYNSYFYLMEHKKQFCLAFKGGKRLSIRATTELKEKETEGARPPKAMKSIGQRKLGRKSIDIVEKVPEKTSSEPPLLTNLYTNNVPMIPCKQKARKSLKSVGNKVESAVNYLDIYQEEEIEYIETNLDKKVRCSVCKKHINEVEKFIRHRLKHITEEVESGTEKSDREDEYKCELCDAKIYHIQRMQHHLILHLQNYSVMRQRNLLEIKRTKAGAGGSEGGRHLLTCPYCKADYQTRIDLANHIRNQCNSRYQCSKCQRTYPTRESLAEHKDQCIHDSNLRGVHAKPIFRCGNCGLLFKIKQQQLWHEHACNKIYNSDSAARVEEIISRTLVCAVCGMSAKSYEKKLKHEARCLRRYLSDAGFGSKYTDDTESDLDMFADSENESESLKAINNELSPKAIEKLKNKHGITREISINLTRLKDDIANKYREKMFLMDTNNTDDLQMDYLRSNFMKLLDRLVNDEEVLESIVDKDGPEDVLVRMLNHMGETPVESNGLSQVAAFSQNLQNFLKVAIKEETLGRAYHKAESISEVIHNLLNFPYELK